ncbi:MAG: division/cell wall cluster transcriptional repressor MraZ [Saprospiraceae bacterium]|nr:MAG: division/cell wall cluster transcriptional repressor MraZ [Saprospiraceae bacterium]
MNQLLGEYPCKIDAKGRLRLPSGLLDQLPGEERESFVVNRGFEKCLYLYPKKVWDGITVQVNNLNVYDTQSRQFQRFFYRGATLLKRDGADRLNLPNQLIEWAGISGDAILAGVNNRMEIWSSAVWNAQLDEEPENFAAIAQAVMGNYGVANPPLLA